MLRVLEKMALPLPLLAFVSFLYHDIEGVVRCGDHYEHAYPITSGIIQGCALSGSIYAAATAAFVWTLVIT